MPRPTGPSGFPYRVIDGGVPQTEQPGPAQTRPIDLSVSELAAELARHFTWSLLADVPAAALLDPHHSVRIDGQTTFSLHDLLCELRNLPWFDAEGMTNDYVTGSSFSSPIVQREAHHRRSLSWNGDGQLTLATLAPGIGTLGSIGAPGAVWHQLDATLRSAASCDLGDWLDAVTPIRASADQTPGTIASDIARTGAAGQFGHALAVFLQDGQVALPWSARDTVGKFHVLMSLAAAEAGRASALARVTRIGRPAAAASCLSIIASYADVPYGDAGQFLAQALSELETHTPRLLGWIDRRNRGDCADRFAIAEALMPFLPLDFERNMMLPRLVVDGAPVHPNKLAGQALVAGAAATFIKAILGSEDTRNTDVDALAQRVATAALLTGTSYHAEVMADLRRGESLARDALRGMLGTTRQTVRLQDFDGRDLVLTPAGNGHRHAALIDGRPIETAHDQPALYAVV